MPVKGFQSVWVTDNDIITVTTTVITDYPHLTVERGTDSITDIDFDIQPFVLAADVYSNPYRAGEAGWTWYTGSAGWYLRAALAAWGEPKGEVETKFKEN